MNRTGTDLSSLEQVGEATESCTYRFRLYIAGTTRNSARALVNIRKFCEEHLKDRYELEIVDITHEPHRACADQIIVIPTLVRSLPLPLRRFIGDMSNTERILPSLDPCKK